MAVQRTVPVPYIAMAARSAVRVQLYVISKSNLLYFWKVRKVVQEKMKSECLQL